MNGPHYLLIYVKVALGLGATCRCRESQMKLLDKKPSTKHNTNLLHLVKIGTKSPDKLTDSDLELEDTVTVDTWNRKGVS